MAKQFGGDWVSVEIKGIEQVQKMLKLLPERVQRKAMKQGVAAGARKVLSEARKLVPVKTGRLKKSLRTRYIKKASRGPFGRIVYKVEAARPEGSHAHLVEFGTSRAAAKPFLRPAFEIAKEPAANAIMDKIAKVMLKEARKLGGG